VFLSHTGLFSTVTKKKKLSIKKEEFTISSALGYYTNTAKEGFRLLTGNQIQFFERLLYSPSVCSPFSEDLFSEIFSQAKEIDNWMTNLVTKEICEQYFSCGDPESLGNICDILMLKNINQKDEKNAKFGMVDIVQYTHDPDFPMNCCSHMDPGLISISVFSTSPGLEFYDPISNEWVQPPSDCSIIWCGEAASCASKGKLKSGIHRVQLDPKFPTRLTMWYEMCTSTQLPSQFLQLHELNFSGIPSFPKETVETFFVKAKTLTGKEILLTGISNSTTILRLKEKIESKEGISPFKNRLIFAGRALADNRTVSDCGIVKGAILHMVLALGS